MQLEPDLEYRYPIQVEVNNNRKSLFDILHTIAK